MAFARQSALPGVNPLTPPVDSWPCAIRPPRYDIGHDRDPWEPANSLACQSIGVDEQPSSYNNPSSHNNALRQWYAMVSTIDGKIHDDVRRSRRHRALAISRTDPFGQNLVGTDVSETDWVPLSAPLVNGRSQQTGSHRIETIENHCQPQRWCHYHETRSNH